MVVLTPRFALLAALSTIAAVSALPTPGDGAAAQVHYRDVDSSSSASAHHSTHAHDFTHTADASRSTSSAGASDEKSQRHSNPVIPLPSSMSDTTIKKVAKSPLAKVGTKQSEHGKGVKSDKGKRFIWDPLNPLLGLGPDIWIGDSPRPGKRHSHDHDRDHDHEKVIVKGDHDHVNVQRSLPVSRIVGRAPDNIIHVSGDVLPHMPRSRVVVPRSPEPHHHHDHDHEEVIVKGDHDHVNVQRRGSPGSTYVADEGGNSYTVAHARRDTLPISGVPGSIDIVTGMSNSVTPQQKIASLVLSSSDNSTMSTGNDTIPSFILNASGTDQTQIYLVAAPSDPSNSTMPPNSTMPSNSTIPSNSTTSSNSTAANPSFIKVALQIPMFDEDAAMLKAYCATFDPNPPAPSPLTVEMCMNGPSTDAHKSQVFAYEPDTGVIRPMWSNSEDDGMSGSADGSATSVSSASPSANSTVSASSTSTANATSVTSQDPAAPTSDKVASMSSLDEQFGDATRPPLRASFAKTFDAPSILAQARNVTLVFTPAAPELIPQKSVDDLDPDMGASSSANATVSATSSSATSSSATSSSATSSSSAIGSTSTTASLTTSSSAASSTSAASTSVASSTSSASNTTVSVSSMSAVPSGAKFVSLSQTTSATTGAVTSSSAASSATAAAPLAVEVYDPTVSASATASGSSSSSSDGASTVTATATTTIGAEDLAATTTAVVTSTATESSVASTMAPMSTASYEWMFPRRCCRARACLINLEDWRKELAF